MRKVALAKGQEAQTAADGFVFDIVHHHTEAKARTNGVAKIAQWQRQTR